MASVALKACLHPRVVWLSNCLGILRNHGHTTVPWIIPQDASIGPSAHKLSSRCLLRSDSNSVPLSRGCSNESGDRDQEQSGRLQGMQSVREELDESSQKLEADDLEFEGFAPDEISRLTGSEKPRREVTDPMGTSVLLFPGQGSQFVGMCREYLEYPNVREMFEVASEILGYNIQGLCLHGPKEELDRTIHCQPAVFLTSLAAVERLKVEDPEAIENCVAAAGFSVGEFAALVFAGSLSFEEAVYLIHVRAEAMQRASEKVRSGMLSVVGRERARYKYICKEAANYCQNNGVEGAVCTVANYLYPDARVLAGNVEALDFIQERSKEFSLKFARRLPVSGAFHTALMEPAVKEFSKALEGVTIDPPVINVISNVDSKPYRNTEKMKELLAKQLVRPVLWEQTMHKIFERPKAVAFPRTFEVGPGKQLGSVLRRTNNRAFERYRKI